MHNQKYQLCQVQRIFFARSLTTSTINRCEMIKASQNLLFLLLLCAKKYVLPNLDAFKSKIIGPDQVATKPNEHRHSNYKQGCLSSINRPNLNCNNFGTIVSILDMEWQLSSGPLSELIQIYVIIVLLKHYQQRIWCVLENVYFFSKNLALCSTARVFMA